MKRTRFAAALAGIGTAAALMLPATGAMADPGRNRPVVVQSRYGGYDSGIGYGRGNAYGRYSPNGRGNAYGRYNEHGRGNAYGWNNRNNRRWNDHARYDQRHKSSSSNNLLPLLGGVLLGAVIAGSR